MSIYFGLMLVCFCLLYFVDMFIYARMMRQIKVERTNRWPTFVHWFCVLTNTQIENKHGTDEDEYEEDRGKDTQEIITENQAYIYFFNFVTLWWLSWSGFFCWCCWHLRLEFDLIRYDMIEMDFWNHTHHTSTDTGQFIYPNIIWSLEHQETR